MTTHTPQIGTPGPGILTNLVAMPKKPTMTYVYDEISGRAVPVTRVVLEIPDLDEATRERIAVHALNTKSIVLAIAERQMSMPMSGPEAVVEAAIDAVGATSEEESHGDATRVTIEAGGRKVETTVGGLKQATERLHNAEEGPLVTDGEGHETAMDTATEGGEEIDPETGEILGTAAVAGEQSFEQNYAEVMQPDAGAPVVDPPEELVVEVERVARLYVGAREKEASTELAALVQVWQRHTTHDVANMVRRRRAELVDA